jgi:hypothetical protein
MRRTAANAPERATGGPGRCAWCTDPKGPEWTRRALDGESVRAIAAGTPYGESAGRRHLRNHVASTLREVSATVEGTRVTDFARRLLVLADEAAAVRQHAHQTHNAGLLLKAVAAERDTLLTLLARLGIDSDDAITALGVTDAMVTALIDVTRAHPELADELAAQVESAGSVEMADAMRALSSRGALTAVPEPVR